MGIQNAHWVYAKTDAAPVIQKNITVQDPAGAWIEICGLGFFELYIEGKKVSEDRFVPSFSDYGKRDLSTLTYPTRDHFRYRVYYRRYEIESYLHCGENTVEILLGNGWFCQTERTAEGHLSYGTPRLAFCIGLAGEEILSDETLKWKDSFIVFHNLFAGETQDFTHDGGAWRPVLPADRPDGGLCPDLCPADREVRKIVPFRVFCDDSRTIWDAGENLSGTVSFMMPGGYPAGTETIVRYAEKLSGENTLYTSSAGSLVQTDRYIGDGTKRRCETHFVWHGFRYFEITGPHEHPEVHVIHSGVSLHSSFSSDRPVLEWLYAATIRSLLSNLHSGVISDCPHRERLGYTGDGQLTCDTALTFLGAESLYEKWLCDIADGQDPETGHVQHTAPFYGGGGGPGGWGCAMVTVPYFLFQHTGNLDIIRRFYPNMEKWISYMETHSENGLVMREEEGGWCLGEWCTPEKEEIPVPFVNTYFFIKSLERLAEMADALGYDPTPYMKKADTARMAVKSAYYDEKTDTYCAGVQGADAFALDIGLGNESMAAVLASKYDSDPEFDTGIFGTDILIRVLFERGYGDTAMKLLCSEAPNSFGGQMLRGETTLCERWNVRWASHNHHMFGACAVTLFRYLLGIRERSDGVSVCPADFSSPVAARGNVVTRFGNLSVERRNGDEAVFFDVLSDFEVRFCFRGHEEWIPAGKSVTLTFGKGSFFSKS